MFQEFSDASFLLKSFGWKVSQSFQLTMEQDIRFCSNSYNLCETIIGCEKVEVVMHAIAKCQSVLHPSDNVPSFNSQCILNSQVFLSKCKQWTTIDYSRKRTDVAFACDIKHLLDLLVFRV